MERRLLLAMVLAVGVLVIWQVIFPPPTPSAPPADAAPEFLAEEPGTSGEMESAARDLGAGEAALAGTDALVPSPETATAAPVVTEESVRVMTLETEQALVMVSNRGGRIQSWKLKAYKDEQGRNLELIPESARRADVLPLALMFEDTAFSEAAAAAVYRMEKGGDGVRQATATFTWADGNGREVRKVLTVGPDFTAAVAVEARQDGRDLPVAVSWGAGFGEETPPGGPAVGVFTFSGRALLEETPRPRRIMATELNAGEIVGAGDRAWGGLEDTYFAALFLPETSGNFRVNSLELPAVDGAEAETALQVSYQLPQGGGSADLYVGPKDYVVLKEMSEGLQEAVHFQSGIWVIGPLVTLLTRGLFHALIYLHQNVVANWGWAIVILTTIIKLVFWPVTQKSMLSMKRMQEKTKKVQPKVAALKEKYRRQGKKDIDSRGKMNQEVMALYQKEGINPMGNLGGCLPLLLQMPILYGFYNLLQVAIELRQAPWLAWVQDLSIADPFYVLPVVMGASMVYQQVLTGAAIADPAQRRMMYFTPVLFTFFFLNMPSGLVLYWLVNNMLGIVQQAMINRRYEKEKAALVPGKRPPAAGKA